MRGYNNKKKQLMGARKETYQYNSVQDGNDGDDGAMYNQMDCRRPVSVPMSCHQHSLVFLRHRCLIRPSPVEAGSTPPSVFRAQTIPFLMM